MEIMTMLDRSQKAIGAKLVVALCITATLPVSILAQAGDVSKLSRLRPIPEEFEPPKANSPVLEAKPTKFGKFGEFRKVADNPPIPDEVTTKRFTVVIVAGTRIERQEWARDARRKYGANVFIFNEVFNISDLALVLKQFPRGSVKTLILGAHEGPTRGIFLGTDLAAPEITADFEVASLQNPRNRQSVQTIREALAANSSVEMHTCQLGKYLNVLKTFASIFQATVWACTGEVGDWGDGAGRGGGIWIYETPQTPAQIAADRHPAIQPIDIINTNKARAVQRQPAP
jgi:hypothetical protein